MSGANLEKVPILRYAGKEWVPTSLAANIGTSSITTTPANSSFAGHPTFHILSKSASDFVIYGPASVSIVDREGDLVTGPALAKALPQLLQRARFSLQHLDISPGEIVPEYTLDGSVFKTEVRPVTEADMQMFPWLGKSGVSVGDDSLFVIGKVWDDTEYCKEVRAQILKGELNSFSISGQALSEQPSFVMDGFTHKLVNRIDRLDLSMVTLCKEGMNPAAKFIVLSKSMRANAAARRTLRKGHQAQFQALHARLAKTAAEMDAAPLEARLDALLKANPVARGEDRIQGNIDFNTQAPKRSRREYNALDRAGLSGTSYGSRSAAQSVARGRMVRGKNRDKQEPFDPQSMPKSTGDEDPILEEDELLQKPDYGTEARKDLSEAHDEMMEELDEGDMEGVEDEAELVAHHAEDIKEMTKAAQLSARLDALLKAGKFTPRPSVQQRKLETPEAGEVDGKGVLATRRSKKDNQILGGGRTTSADPENWSKFQAANKMRKGKPDQRGAPSDAVEKDLPIGYPQRPSDHSNPVVASSEQATKKPAKPAEHYSYPAGSDRTKDSANEENKGPKGYYQKLWARLGKIDPRHHTRATAYREEAREFNRDPGNRGMPAMTSQEAREQNALMDAADNSPGDMRTGGAAEIVAASRGASKPFGQQKPQKPQMFDPQALGKASDETKGEDLDAGRFGESSPRSKRAFEQAERYRSDYGESAARTARGRQLRAPYREQEAPQAALASGGVRKARPPPLSHESDSEPQAMGKAWIPFQGKRGAMGARNTDTNEIVYGERARSLLSQTSLGSFQGEDPATQAPEPEEEAEWADNVEDASEEQLQTMAAESGVDDQGNDVGEGYDIPVGEEIAFQSDTHGLVTGMVMDSDPEGYTVESEDGEEFYVPRSSIVQKGTMDYTMPEDKRREREQADTQPADEESAIGEERVFSPTLPPEHRGTSVDDDGTWTEPESFHDDGADGMDMDGMPEDCQCHSPMLQRMFKLLRPMAPVGQSVSDWLHKAAFTTLGAAYVTEFRRDCPTCFSLRKEYDNLDAMVNVIHKAATTGVFAEGDLLPYDLMRFKAEYPSKWGADLIMERQTQ